MLPFLYLFFCRFLWLFVFAHSPCPSCALSMSLLASSSSFSIYHFCLLALRLLVQVTTWEDKGSSSLFTLSFLCSLHGLLGFFQFLLLCLLAPALRLLVQGPTCQTSDLFSLLILYHPFHDGLSLDFPLILQCFLSYIWFVCLFLRLFYHDPFGLSSPILLVLLMLSLCFSWLHPVPSLLPLQSSQPSLWLLVQSRVWHS